MTYTAPSKADFIARFPTFAAVEDDTYALWAGDAAVITEAQEDCLGDGIDLATMLFTAHYLTLAGLGTGAEAEMAAQGMAGFKSIKSGTLSLERGDSSAGGNELSATSYGARAWAMLKPCLVGPRVTATGTYPVYPGYCGRW